MPPPGQLGPAPGRAVAVAGAGVALLAAALVASGATPGGTERRLQFPELSGLVVMLFMAALMAGLVLGILGLRGSRHALPRRRGWLAQLLPLLIALAALALWGPHTRPDGSVPAEPGSEAADGTGSPRDAPAAGGRGEVGLVLVLLGAGVLLAVLTAHRASSGSVEDAERPADQRIGELLADLAGDLEADMDARRAVIRAYQRLEGVLAVHGLGRRPSEAPRELLTRVLSRLPGDVAPAAAHRLTALFEQAMFSSHEIDEAMRTDAVRALRAVADGLRGAPATARSSA